MNRHHDEFTDKTTLINLINVEGGIKKEREMIELW
jgi:hypothetical protein